MNAEMKKYVEDFERDVNEIRSSIEQAKQKLNSRDWNNESLRATYERLVTFHESQLKIVIENHNVMMSIWGVGE